MDELQTILPVEYSRAQLETTFRKYDADGSGALGLDEFKMLVIDLERELISRELMDRGAKVFIYFNFSLDCMTNSFTIFHSNIKIYDY